MFSNTCAMTLAQKSDRILAQTRGLSGATPNATQLIEELRWALEENRREVERLRAERDEAFILANQVAREAASIITAKIPSGKASAFWDALDKFRRFESRLPESPSGREQENR